MQLSIDGRALLDSPSLLLADIRDIEQINQIFEQHRPQVVFHAAALKHLTLLERNPGKAVKGNVWGTLTILDASRANHVERFVNMTGQRSFLLVGDSKLVSYANLSAMVDAGVTFVPPASKSYVSTEVLAACDKARAVPVVYVPERHTARTTPADPPVYPVYEDTTAIAGPRKADPALALRRVFVWSSGNAQAAVANRTRKCGRAADDLERVTRGLGTGRPPLQHARQSARQGRSHRPRPACQRQEVVERRYGDYKGPMAVAPCC